MGKANTVNEKKIEAVVSSPSGNASGELRKEDVWGEFDVVNAKRISKGMIIASFKETCPVFGDVVPFKSVTVVCPEVQFDDVAYWLVYVHGAGCISKTKRLGNGEIAIRSNYQCW